MSTSVHLSQFANLFLRMIPVLVFGNSFISTRMTLWFRAKIVGIFHFRCLHTWAIEIFLWHKWTDEKCCCLRDMIYEDGKVGNIELMCELTNVRRLAWFASECLAILNNEVEVTDKNKNPIWLGVVIKMIWSIKLYYEISALHMVTQVNFTLVSSFRP